MRARKGLFGQDSASVGNSIHRAGGKCLWRRSPRKTKVMNRLGHLPMAEGRAGGGWRGHGMVTLTVALVVMDATEGVTASDATKV